MKHPLLKTFFLFLFLSSSTQILADIKLPAIVGDGMVLQRGQPIKIWGWADPGEKVTVTLKKKKYAATTNGDGLWAVTIKPQKAGGSHEITIQGNNTIVLKDILFGDVWICSGQSNMTHYFGRHQERYAKEISESTNSEIRQFLVPTTADMSGPKEDIEGLQWTSADPESILKFTVIGYFFAKKLYDKYEVPMGIINTCVGGTKIESWMSEEGLNEFPEIIKTIQQNRDTAYVNQKNREAQASRDAYEATKTPDLGMTGEVKWYNPEYKPLNWKPINIPGYWEDQGLRDLDGVVWYRREIDIPESMTGVDVKAYLGRIIDADEFYVNGQKVGNTSYQYPQREYVIPKGVLKQGKNLLVVRVTNNGGKGGFIPDKPYYLLANGQQIDLKGTWQYKVGTAYRKDVQIKWGIRAQDQPTSLYNGMIAPCINYGVKGFLWYQGESNAGNPTEYKKLLPALIVDWRSKWQQADATFLIAQLPNYMEVDYQPAESNWALMREAQLKTALETPNAGLGINIELGEWNDIHPGNKKPVGERLALKAMELTYGEKDIVSSGPIFKSQTIDGSEITLTFDYTGSGLVSTNGEELGHFAIAGEDKTFYWASAKIVGDQVVVSSDRVPNPKYVRYAWADNPDFANLGNKEGLPASPFRTDL